MTQERLSDFGLLSMGGGEAGYNNIDRNGKCGQFRPKLK